MSPDNALYICPICFNKMSNEQSVDSYYKEYFCRNNIDDHFYAQRTLSKNDISKGIPENISKIKFRIMNGNKNIYLRINFDQDYMTVWSDGMNRSNIPGTFVPDFSDIGKLKDKILTLLLFS